MPRPKNSSPKSYELIFNALITGPKCYSDIIKITGLHRNTVSSRLKFLVNKGLVRKKRVGNKMIYEFNIKYLDKHRGLMSFEALRDWAYLMTTRENKYEYLDKYIELWLKFDGKRIARIANKAIREFILEENKEKLEHEEVKKFIEIIKERKESLPLQQVISHIEVPYCLECYKKYGKLIKGIYDPETNEYVCQECGLVIRTSPP